MSPPFPLPHAGQSLINAVICIGLWPNLSDGLRFDA